MLLVVLLLLVVVVVVLLLVVVVVVLLLLVVLVLLLQVRALMAAMRNGAFVLNCSGHLPRPGPLPALVELRVLHLATPVQLGDVRCSITGAMMRVAVASKRGPISGPVLLNPVLSQASCEPIGEFPSHPLPSQVKVFLYNYSVLVLPLSPPLLAEFQTTNTQNRPAKVGAELLFWAPQVRPQEA